MSLLRKLMRNKLDIKKLYVVSTGNAIREMNSNMFFLGYSYQPNSISIVRIKSTDSKSCKDVISGRRLYVFDNSDSIRIHRTYCSNIKPLYNFIISDRIYADILKKEKISLDEICMFLAEMNDSFY